MKIKPRTKEEILELNGKLKEQLLLFGMELSYEEAQLKFRMVYEAWYDERITLDDALKAMMESMDLCREIGVWGAK